MEQYQYIVKFKITR